MRSLSHHRSSCPKAFSVYQRCAAANATDTWICNEILLKQVTVDCLAGSGTPLIDHYRRCLETACNLDNSARDPMIRYIDNNCGEDGKSEPLVVVLYSSSAHTKMMLTLAHGRNGYSATLEADVAVST